MSDGGRNRASIGVGVLKSSRKGERTAVRSSLHRMVRPCHGYKPNLGNTSDTAINCKTQIMIAIRECMRMFLDRTPITHTGIAAAQYAKAETPFAWIYGHPPFSQASTISAKIAIR